MAFSDHFWEGALYTDSATGLLLSPPFCHTPILSQVESYPVEYMSRGERLCPGLVASLGWLRTSALSPCCSLSFRLLSLSHPLHNSGSFSFWHSRDSNVSGSTKGGSKIWNSVSYPCWAKGTQSWSSLSPRQTGLLCTQFPSHCPTGHALLVFTHLSWRWLHFLFLKERRQQKSSPGGARPASVLLTWNNPVLGIWSYPRETARKRHFFGINAQITSSI